MKALALLAAACLAPAFAEPVHYASVSRDSIPAYANVRIAVVATDTLPAEGAYCGKLVFAGVEDLKDKQGGQAAWFRCGDGKVQEFTYAGASGADAEFLFKPAGTREEYFGKTRIPFAALEKIYKIEEKNRRRMTEREADHVASTVAVTTIVLLAVVVLVVYMGEALYGN